MDRKGRRGMGIMCQRTNRKGKKTYLCAALSLEV